LEGFRFWDVLTSAVAGDERQHFSTNEPEETHMKRILIEI
jgi:hypothetical protein